MIRDWLLSLHPYVRDIDGTDLGLGQQATLAAAEAIDGVLTLLFIPFKVKPQVSFQYVKHLSREARKRERQG